MKEKVLEIIKRTFEIEEVQSDVSQKNCANWDSMNHLNLILEIESEFNVSFEPEDIAEIKSADDIVNLLTRMGIN